MPDNPGELQRQVEQYRKALLARERTASARLVREYGKIWRRIDREIQDLAGRYYRALQAGTASGTDWVYQFGRLRELRRQALDELVRFARYAENEINASQLAAAERALNESEQLLRVGIGEIPPGVSLRFNKLPRSAVRSMVGTMQANSVLVERLTQIAGEGAQAVQDGLVQGLALGQNPRVIARAIRDDLGAGLSKAMTWARTETLRAYRSATLATYRENDDMVKGWMWRSARNERTCAMCWAMDGTLLELEEDLDDHPNGRCFAVPVMKTWREMGFDIDETVKPKETGLEAFEKLSNAEKAKVLGRSKMAAYQDGRFTLNDLVGRRLDPRWGSMRYERSLREIGIDWKEYKPEPEEVEQ